jgi:alkanesulfonate monooxygenase SsuD/methylene tetrahydromethanopterin reductase-like flavin-dependent oxidoreductase (luciferase family)
MDEVIAAAKLADEAGLDMFAVGEHHRRDFTVSATATVLAAVAAVTTRIRLSSASTLLSTADPVRTFQEFATVDLISGGRTEIIVGRGALTDGFPLFGFDLKDYDALFAEKLGLLMALNKSERVTWSGVFRPALHNAEVAPRPFQERLPLWVGAGSPQSVTRAASLGLPLAVPMLGGDLPHYAQIVALGSVISGIHVAKSTTDQ